MPSTLKRVDDPHDAPIAPDIVPADWADCVPAKPARDAASREKLFAEIRNAAEAAAPKVDNSFRASDVNDIPALKDRTRLRAWLNRALTVFVLALVSAIATAVWKHHGATATETLTAWVSLPGVSASPEAEPATEPTAEPAAQPAAEQQAAAPQPAEAPAPQPAQMPATSTAALPPEAEQQIQSMARDLAAMGEQIEQLKATIETLKANQQAAAAAPPPVARAPAPPPKPKVTSAPPRPAPAPHPPRPAYSPAMQAAAVPPPSSPTPSAYPPPQPYSPPPQATTQPNGEPIVRPPMPMPLSDRY